MNNKYQRICIGGRTYWMLMFFLSAPFFSTGQIFKATLNGANQSPPNASTGTGSVTVTITQDPRSMRVQANFTGLLGTSTVAHIHAPTTQPGTGTTGVATQTPGFVGFPSGVTAGSYDVTFDMDQTSNYNSSFLTNQGGTAAAAFAALLAALNENKAYFNLHSTVFPGGEITGFLIPQTYQILPSMLTFSGLSEAISTAMPGETIQQINHATETAPIEFPSGYTFELGPPFTFSINIP